MDLLTHIKSKIIILCYAITLSLKYKQVTSLSKYKILLDSVITYVKMETTIIVEHDNAAWRGDVLSYHETNEKKISAYGTQLVNFLAPIFYRDRDDRLPSCLSTAPLVRFARLLAEQRIRHDVTSGRNVCAGRLLWGKERCEIRLTARMELKRVSCACFGGRSFAMSLLASLIRTNERMNVNVARSWILDYILARRCSSSYLTVKKGFIISLKVSLYRLKCNPLLINTKVLVRKNSYIVLLKKNTAGVSCYRSKNFYDIR